MAITLNGTKVSIKAENLPTGYTKPTVTEVTGAEYKRNLTLTVAKSAVENADPAVTMANILTEVAQGINKQLQDILDADYIATNTVEAHGDLIAISSNQKQGNAAFFNADPVAYECTVALYVKTS